MILLDSNLLVYSHVSSLPQHKMAKAWLDQKLNGSAAVGIPWPAILTFLRLVTNPRVFGKAESISSAWKQIEAWLDCPVVWLPTPTERHREILAELIKESNPSGNLIPDVHLAALALEHGLILCSTDGDFARFSRLKLENPLAQ